MSGGGAPSVQEPTARETPLAPVHRELGAKLVPFAGFVMPVQYESITAEHRAVRERAGLFDISHMGELWIGGPEAASFLDRMTTNDVAALAVDQAQYSCMCLEDGGVIDDLVLYRLADGYMMVVNASNIAKDHRWLAEHAPAGVTIEDRSDQTALLALQGPRAESILAPLASVDLSEIRTYWKADGTVAGIPAVISRTGYTGEDGFELYVHAERGIDLWNTLMRAGEAYGLVPAGLGARDTLRLEMKYALYGNDIDEATNPLEAGLGWVVRLDKGDFVGRDALRRVKQEGPRRRLVGFRLLERGFPRPHYPVLLDGREVAFVRSGTVSPTLGAGIGTCYLPAGAAGKGTRVAVMIREKQVSAEVARTPFYRRGSTLP